MYRVLLIAIALILYGSLWPWQYNPAHAGGNPLSILFHSWPPPGSAYDVEDIVVNLLLYMPVGMFGYLALDRHHHRRLRVIGPILLGFALSGSIEMLQIYDQTRMCSAVDLLCNTVSAGMGVLLGYLFRQSHAASLRRFQSVGNLHASGPLVLVFIWVGFQTIPLFPLTFKILPKLQALYSAHFSVVEMLASFTAWLVVAHLLEAIYDAKLGWSLLLPLSLLAPAKIFQAHRTPTLGELAGVALALLVWKTTLLKAASRTKILAALMILFLIVNGLWPFHLAGSNPFSWIPFVALLQSPWESGLVTLCQKSFWYGSAIWLLWAAGCRLPAAAALIAMLLGVIEVVQIHLPGHTPESTDPLLALLLGSVLWFLELHGRRAKAQLPEPELVTADSTN